MKWSWETFQTLGTMQRSTFIYKLKNLAACRGVLALIFKFLFLASGNEGSNGVFVSRSCWKRSLLSSILAGQMMTEGGPSLSVLSWIQWYLAVYSLDWWECEGQCSPHRLEAQSQIHQEEDSEHSPWAQCSMYLWTPHVYRKLHETFLGLGKMYSNKSSPTRENWVGAFVLSRSTKQWLQVGKRPETLGFLSSLTGCSLQPTSWVCLACCWHLCSPTSLQTLISVRFLIAALRTIWFDVFLMHGRFSQVMRSIGGYSGLIFLDYQDHKPPGWPGLSSFPSPKHVIRNIV